MTPSSPFFDHPILNSPYDCPQRHWELDADGQPTQQVLQRRRRAEFITPIKRKTVAQQKEMVFDEGQSISTQAQQYDPTSIINEVRQSVDTWRALPNPGQWQVTPETARLLQHWRHHKFSGVRPFFCQVEAAETAIWLTEVAPQSKGGKKLLDHLASANKDANPELMRLALKLATGAGKTTAMAMLIAWQTVNAVRHPGSKQFTRGFLICAPGLTIKDRLRLLQPNDPNTFWGVVERNANGRSPPVDCPLIASRRSCSAGASGNRPPRPATGAQRVGFRALTRCARSSRPLNGVGGGKAPAWPLQPSDGQHVDVLRHVLGLLCHVDCPGQLSGPRGHPVLLRVRFQRL